MNHLIAAASHSGSASTASGVFAGIVLTGIVALGCLAFGWRPFGKSRRVHESPAAGAARATGRTARRTAAKVKNGSVAPSSDDAS